MSRIDTLKLTEAEASKLLALQEGHFCDLKAIDIAPGKLSRSIAAFSNAEGGELFIGIDEDKKSGTRKWRGFAQPEDANGHIQAFEGLFPLSADFLYDFLATEGHPGLILKIQTLKTRDIKSASNDRVYVRRGAQNIPVDTDERLDILRRDKGLSSFETETVNCDPIIVTNSEQIISFMLEVVPTAEPEQWLRKQMILTGDKPTVAGVVLFADEPQAALPKRCGIKVYRYKTSDGEGTRESLDSDPISIEGSAYEQIKNAVTTTQSIIECVRIRTPQGLQAVRYPDTAVHEVITNAVLHRDYSIADDIHIKIFDNRVEILSPGTLPGHVTEVNILDERFARNCAIVRLINKFPDPPNKDVGEGLNTAFQAMREMKLKDPVITQSGGYVIVQLRHESLASPEEAILEYLATHDDIANRNAREICYIGSENKMKGILQRMVKSGLIELVPGRTRYNAAYRVPVVDEGETAKQSMDSDNQ
ncbi:MAG: ATP-binding protein [Candidatus Sedimenticola sp. (ex Thyasira tokunagai)]